MILNKYKNFEYKTLGEICTYNNNYWSRHQLSLQHYVALERTEFEDILPFRTRKYARSC